MFRKFSTIAALAAITAAVAVQSASAQQTTYTWAGGSGLAKQWTNTANWDPNTAYPNANTDDANLNVALAGATGIDLLTDVTIGNLTMGSSSNAVATEIASAGGTLILNDASGNATITSAGVAGVTNVISAAVRLSDGTTEFAAASTQPLHISGNVQQAGGNQVLLNNATAQTLTVGSGVLSTIQLYDATLGVGTARNFEFRNLSSTATGGISQATTVNAAWEGPGTIKFGDDSNSRNAGMTYTLLQSQTSASSVNTGRQKYILSADNPFGVGTLTANNSNQTNWGGVWQSTDDSRVVGNSSILVGNNFAVAGSNSIEFTGNFGVTNNRNVGNNLDAGKTWTLSGPVYVNIKSADPTARTLTLDGTGRTVMSGVVNNNITDNTVVGSIAMRGSGRLEVTNPANTISGTWSTNGGLIVFGTAGSYGGAGSTIVANAAGGVSYAPGTADAGFATFAGKLTGGTGYLALPASDAASNLDFSGSGALATAPNLSVTGDGVMTYTGVVTPGAAGYNWGGPQGTLTLGANAGTGAHKVTYTNGGSVVVNGSPDYTDVTTIKGVQYASAQVYITNGQNTNGTQTFNLPTTLEVTSLGDAGSASSLGASSNAAGNLVIDRATLRVNSATAQSTDRLFTVGPAGATIESAGAGLVTIGSGGGANVGPSSAATLTLAGAGNGALGSVLANGGGVLSLAKTGAGTWSLDAVNTYTGTTTVSEGTLVVNGQLGTGAVTVSSGAFLAMGNASTLAFSTGGPSITATGTMSFASGFGVANLTGLDDSTPAGTYTIVAGNVDLTGVNNVGIGNAYSYGSLGSYAYFQSGSLQLVVVPEPSSMAAVATGAFITVMIRRRSRG